MFLQDDRTDLVHSPEVVAGFVDRLVPSLAQESSHSKGQDRRANRRQLLSVPIRVVSLDGSLRPLGPEFTATTLAISNRGLSLIHYKNLRCSMLAVELMDGDHNHLQIPVKITRCRPLGAYFETAGVFVTEEYHPPNGEDVSLQPQLRIAAGGESSNADRLLDYRLATTV